MKKEHKKRDVRNSGSVRRRELSSEGRGEAEKLGEMVGEGLKEAAREEELCQTKWESERRR